MNKALKIQRIIYLIVILQLVLALLAISAWSQSQNLDDQYNQLIEKSETYDKYKVIPKNKIDELWANVQIEVNKANQAISALKVSNAEAKSSKDSLNARIVQLSRQVNESEMRNGSISFFGINMKHNLYHSMVWGIIGVLVAGMVYFGLRYKMNLGVVDQLLLEKEALASDFEDHKFNAHQKMLKTKRELQTALNQLEDHQVQRT